MLTRSRSQGVNTAAAAAAAAAVDPAPSPSSRRRHRRLPEVVDDDTEERGGRRKRRRLVRSDAGGRDDDGPVGSSSSATRDGSESGSRRGGGGGGRIGERRGENVRVDEDQRGGHHHQVSSTFTVIAATRGDSERPLLAVATSPSTAENKDEDPQEGVEAEPPVEEQDEIGFGDGGDDSNGPENGTPPPPSPQCCAICFKEENRNGDVDGSSGGGCYLIALPCCGGGSDYHHGFHSESSRRPPTVVVPDRELTSSTRFCRDCIARHAHANGFGSLYDGCDNAMVVECPCCRGLLHVTYRLDWLMGPSSPLKAVELRTLSLAQFRHSMTYAMHRSDDCLREALRLISEVYPHFIPVELFVATAGGNRAGGHYDAEALVRWGILDRRGDGDDAGVYRIGPERQRLLREEWDDQSRRGADEDLDSQLRADRRSPSKTTLLFRLLLHQAVRATDGVRLRYDIDEECLVAGGTMSDFYLAGDVFAASLEAFAVRKFVTALRLFNQFCVINLRAANFLSPFSTTGRGGDYETEFRREWHGWLVSALNVVLVLLVGSLLVVTVLHLILCYSIIRAVGWAVWTSSPLKAVELRTLSLAQFRHSVTYAMHRLDDRQKSALRLISEVYPHFVPLELFVAIAGGIRAGGHDDAEALVRWGILDRRGDGDDSGVYRIGPERQRLLREALDNRGGRGLSMRHLLGPPEGPNRSHVNFFRSYDIGNGDEEDTDDDDEEPDSQRRADRRSTSNSTLFFRLILHQAVRATDGVELFFDLDGERCVAGGTMSDFYLAGDVFAAGLEAFAVRKYFTALRLFNQFCVINLRAANFLSPFSTTGRGGDYATEFRHEWHGWLVSALNVVLLLLVGPLLVVTVLYLILCYSIIRAVGWAVWTSLASSLSTRQRPGRGNELRALVRGVLLAAVVVVGGLWLWYLWESTDPVIPEIRLWLWDLLQSTDPVVPEIRFLVDEENGLIRPECISQCGQITLSEWTSGHPPFLGGHNFV